MTIAKIRKEMEKLVAKAAFSLREDLKKLLKKAYRNEKSTKAKTALKWILDNAKIAQNESVAICQDTGFPIVFIEAGSNVGVSSSLIKAIEQGIEAGYRKNYLRPSVVDPLIRGGSSYKGVMYHLDFLPKARGLKITIFPKGFGSENKTQLKMFNPTASLVDIEDFVVKSVEKAGAEGCPPFVIGVGIGGSSDMALCLAKKSLLERIDKPNTDRFLNNLEKRLLKKINSLKIGPMGLGGKHTCLAIKIKKTPTHIAGLPVGINISCHALRSAEVHINL